VGTSPSAWGEEPSLHSHKNMKGRHQTCLSSILGNIYTQEIGAKIMTVVRVNKFMLEILANTIPNSSSFFCPWYLYALLIFSVNSGTFSNKSPTRPTSATWKMGASASLLIAAMTLLSFIPAKCWMAPEIPAQR
jgi:hypothetical protein